MIKDPAYQRESARLTQRLLDRLPSLLCQTCWNQLARFHCTAETCKAPLTQRQRDEFKAILEEQHRQGPLSLVRSAPREEWTVEDWENIDRWAKQKRKAKQKEKAKLRYPHLRGVAVEWLRMETLLLADRLGLFTEAGLRTFLKSRRMRNPERAIYLKALLRERDPKTRRQIWQRHRDDHASDLKRAKDGAHHVLLRRDHPEQEQIPYAAFGCWFPGMPGQSAITALTTQRVRVQVPGQPGYIEKTVIVPGMVADETRPGAARLDRPVYAVDLTAGPAVREEFKKLTRASKNSQRQLAHMWEALQLYADAALSRQGRHELHILGKKAKTFRSSMTPPEAVESIASRGSRGQKIRTLAEDMLMTALLPPYNIPWARAFL